MFNNKKIEFFLTLFVIGVIFFTGFYFGLVYLMIISFLSLVIFVFYLLKVNNIVVEDEKQVEMFSVLSHSKDGIALFNEKGDLLYHNSSFFYMTNLNYPKGNTSYILLGLEKMFKNSNIEREDIETLKWIMSEGGNFYFEFKMPHSEAWRGVDVLVTNDGLKFFKIVDATKKKENEEKHRELLKNTAARLRSYVFPCIICDLENKSIFFENNRSKKMFKEYFEGGYELIDIINSIDWSDNLNIFESGIDSNVPVGTANFFGIKYNVFCQNNKGNYDSIIDTTFVFVPVIPNDFVVINDTDKSSLTERNNYSLDQLGAIYSQAPVGIVVLDKNSVILEANQWLSKLISKPRKTILNNKISTYLVPKSLEAFNVAFSDVINEKINLLEVELELLGVEIRYGVKAIFKYFDLGGEAAVLLYLIDNSTQKYIEKQMLSQSKDAVAGQISGTVAHDLNNFLTGITFICDSALKNLRIDDLYFEEFTRVKHLTKKSSDSVRSMLNLVRDNNRQDSVTNIVEEIEWLGKTFFNTLGSNIRVNLHLGRNIRSIALCNTLFTRIIMNITNNARDAMPKGGDIDLQVINVSYDNDIEYRGKLIHSGKYVKLSISDTGVGIPEDKVNKIFEPYYTTKDEHTGTGLGLSSVAIIVDKNNGYIFVDSELQKGTTFTVLLPEAVDNHFVMLKNDTVFENLTGTSKILFAEDEEYISRPVTKALTNLGHKVVAFSNGQDALEAYDDSFDILITDARMPKMDGIKLVEQIKKINPDLPIIMTSGYAENIFEDGNPMAGIEFISKPFSVDILASKIKHLLGNKKSNRENQ